MAQRWPRRGIMSCGASRTAKRSVGLLLILLFAAVLMTVGLLFRSMVTELAVSAAKDAVVMRINAVVKELMTNMALRGEGLVVLERDDRGSITAVATDVAAVNSLSAEILERAVSQTGEQVLTLKIPLGNLTGSALFLNRGPSVPVDVVMLSSSMAGFRSELTSAGINQTRHQIMLELSVQISLLMPWHTVASTVETEVLVSEIVIVGDVPDSYMDWGNTTWMNQ